LLHKEFKDATVFFVGFVLSVLGDNLVDAYLHIRDGKELWDALEAKFGVADAGDKLYAMEQFNDYKMVENRSENKVMSCRLWLRNSSSSSVCFQISLSLDALSLSFPSWRSFATSLKHLMRISLAL
jgi:hypothetical protein